MIITDHKRITLSTFMMFWWHSNQFIMLMWIGLIRNQIDQNEHMQNVVMEHVNLHGSRNSEFNVWLLEPLIVLINNIDWHQGLRQAGLIQSLTFVGHSFHVAPVTSWSNIWKLWTRLTPTWARRAMDLWCLRNLIPLHRWEHGELQYSIQMTILRRSDHDITSKTPN